MEPASSGTSSPVVVGTWTCSALPEAVGDLRRHAWMFARAHGVPEGRLRDIELAISEAVSNAVLHAFRDRPAPGSITLSLEIRPGAVADVIVRDDGSGMQHRSDSPGLGFGLTLIERVADEIEQRRPADGDGFELWMRFRLDVGRAA